MNRSTKCDVDIKQNVVQDEELVFNGFGKIKKVLEIVVWLHNNMNICNVTELYT